MLFALFLLLSFVSYISGAWRVDDVFYNRENSLIKSLLNEELIVHNWMGKMGAYFSFTMVKKWFGLGSFLLLLIMFCGGLKMVSPGIRFRIGRLTYLSVVFTLLISACLGYALGLFSGYTSFPGGGFFGALTTEMLESVAGKIGTGLILGFLVLISVVLSFNINLKRKPATETAVPSDPMQHHQPPESFDTPVVETVTETTRVVEFDLKEDQEEPEKDVIQVTEELEKPVHQEIELTVVDPASETSESEEEEEALPYHGDLDTPYDPTLDLSQYQFPPIDLLMNYGSGTTTVNKEELDENKNRIIQTLKNYAIEIDKFTATIGPTVTLYEIVPAAGIRISRIKNLEDDIALSLSAYGIRIIAPIPGKGTIGIEVPNQKPEIVSMRSVLTSDRFQSSKFELPVALGKTISNETYVVDLTKMPHLLMAGATGQGKSVGLNAIITSLLYKKHPAEIKFVMVDPKKVELSLFSKIENHYLATLPDFDEAIITDTRKVVRVLNSMLIEMDNRYNLLKDAQVRNIKEYNTKFISRKLNPEKGHRFLPYIILVVDEFADLIMTAGKEIETPLTRLAQLARAIGMHLIIATQRPSVNIITGTIKANFPARAAFRVISKIDSRTILDTGGADQLIGRGDMLLSVGSEFLRLQCAFIDTGEIENICSFVGSQRGYPHTYFLPEYFEESDEGGRDADPTQRDEMFEDAARLVVTHQQGSTSLLQRKLKLGYNRAGRIMDQLESAGIVGPPDGSKARDVKIKDPYVLEQLLREGA